jgi:hypothetical protein
MLHLAARTLCWAQAAVRSSAETRSRHNIFRELGVYATQSQAVLKALAESTAIKRNVLWLDRARIQIRFL